MKQKKVVVLLMLLISQLGFGEVVLPCPPFEIDLQGTKVVNLLLNKKATASRTWSKQSASLAVDGNSSQSSHWAGDTMPVWHQVDMGSVQTINQIKFVPYYDGRYYQYKIEGSTDGKSWQLLVDQSDNTTPGTKEGFQFSFTPTKTRYIRTTFSKNSFGDNRGGHIVEIAAYNLDSRWVKTESLSASFASFDQHYYKYEFPELTPQKTWKQSAWKGERIHTQAVAWSPKAVEQLHLVCSDLINADGEKLNTTLRANFIRYVIGQNKNWPDVIDDVERISMKSCSVRPIYIAADIPASAKPGVYTGTVKVKALGEPTTTLTVKFEVLDITLPPAKDWKFHLDLWQHPYSVSGHHDVKPWSEQHFALMKPIYQRLANAGQKCITASIIHRPWGGQTYHPWGSMVEWTKKKDGTWAFDYENFDKYVEFAIDAGIDGTINCYSMVSWTNSLRYFDEAVDAYITVSLNPVKPEFRELWTPFLVDFRKHLKAKGWLERTLIAMDERPKAQMKAAITLVKELAPELGIAVAGNSLAHIDADLVNEIDDFSMIINAQVTEKEIQERNGKGLKSTFYVCCGPARPNTFVKSSLDESATLGWICANKNYSGFLRWAYNAWTANPDISVNHTRWKNSPGDCYLVYPRNRSSIRFERLREGIQDYEKINILRSKLADTAELKALETILSEFTYKKTHRGVEAGVVTKAKAVLEKAARKAIQ